MDILFWNTEQLWLKMSKVFIKNDVVGKCNFPPFLCFDITVIVVAPTTCNEMFILLLCVTYCDGISK